MPAPIVNTHCDSVSVCLKWISVLSEIRAPPIVDRSTFLRGHHLRAGLVSAHARQVFFDEPPGGLEIAKSKFAIHCFHLSDRIADKILIP